MAEGGYDIDDTVTSNNIQEQLGTPPPSDSHGQGGTVQVSNINTPYHDLQMNILNQHHVEIRNTLNVTSVFPYLNRCGLIPRSVYNELDAMPGMIGLEINYSKIDKIVYTVIPNCGHEDFLRRFIGSLRESAQDAGDAHTELAESLEQALNQANNEYDDDTDDTEYETATELTVMIGGNRSRPQLVENIPTERGIKRPCCALFCCISIFGCLLLLAIAGTIILGHLTPHSSLTFPHKMKEATGSLTALELGLKTTWVSTVVLQFTGSTSPSIDCSGSVHIISGRSCDSLLVQEDYFKYLKSLTYLLPGSQINITFDKSVFDAERVKAIWLVSSISAHHNIHQMDDNNIDNPCELKIAKDKDYYCFPANMYNLSHPILFDVNSSGYYSMFVFGGIYSGVYPSVMARTYNFSALVEDKLIGANISLPSQTKVDFKVNNRLSFNGESCILIESRCPGPQSQFSETDWTLVAVHKRTDLLLFPELLVIIFVVILSLLLVATVYLCVKRHRRRC